MKIRLVAATALTALLAVLSGCKPSDQNVLSVRQQLESGKTVVFSQKDYRRPSCRYDWTDMRLGDENERERIVLKQQSSFVNLGINACYRIGSVVSLNVFGHDMRDPGLVRITRLSLVQVDHVNLKSLRGSYFSAKDTAGSYIDQLKPHLSSSDHNAVTIVDFEYVGGSAADEAALKQKDAEDKSDPHYRETIHDGDQLSTDCNKAWTYLTVRPEVKDNVLNGDVKSWYRFGDLSCFKQGDVMDLEIPGEGGKGYVAFAKAKITKVKNFRVSAAQAGYFNLPHFDFSKVAEWLQADNKKSDEFVSVVDFEIQKDGGQK